MPKLLKNSKSDLLKLSLTLFAIAFVMSALVSFVSNVTSEKIADINKQKVSDALLAVMPDAVRFEEVLDGSKTVISSDGKEIDIDGIWKAYGELELLGVCVKVSPKGYGGKIETIVSVDSNGEIISSQIVSMSETSGIGTKISNESFLSQFVGKQGNISQEDGEELLISGATKSSKAFLRGINAALSVANEHLEVLEVE